MVFFVQVTVTRSARDHPETLKRSFCPRAASRQETLLETRAVTRATRTWRTVMTAFLTCDSPALLFLLSVISAWSSAFTRLSAVRTTSAFIPSIQRTRASLIHSISYSWRDFALRFHFSPISIREPTFYRAAWFAEFVLNQKEWRSLVLNQYYSLLQLLQCYNIT